MISSILTNRTNVVPERYDAASRFYTGAAILIPVYIFPTGGGTSTPYVNFFALASRFKDIPIYAIVNPSSGPGTSISGSYTSVMRKYGDAGVQTIGYVYTSYGARSVASIKSDIDTWLSYYPSIMGIFLDECPTANNATYISNLAEVTTYCHDRGLGLVIGNPGTAPHANYYTQNSADAFIVKESAAIPTEGYLQSTGTKPRRGVILHSQPTWDVVTFDVIETNCQYAYITDDAVSYFDTFSGYLEYMLDYLRNDPGNYA